MIFRVCGSCVGFAVSRWGPCVGFAVSRGGLLWGCVVGDHENWYFSISMLRGYLGKRGVESLEVERLLGEFVDQGFVWFRGVCIVWFNDPCRYCGGTGHILVVKFSGYARVSCDRCGGRGYKPVGPDEDTVLEP